MKELQESLGPGRLGQQAVFLFSFCAGILRISEAGNKSRYVRWFSDLIYCTTASKMWA